MDGRIQAVVALAPGGSSNPPPGTIPSKLTFQWKHDVPTLYLVAEDDRALPLAGTFELFGRTQSPKRMVVLRRADHGHFADEFEQQAGMSSNEEAHLVIRCLTLCHFHAVLKQSTDTHRFLAGDIVGELATRGATVTLHET